MPSDNDDELRNKHELYFLLMILGLIYIGIFIGFCHILTRC